MSKMVSFFTFSKPATQMQRLEDNAYGGSGSSFNNYSWYQKVIQGSATRMNRYLQWDHMDTDVMISRGLDTIAEECVANYGKDEQPLKIVYIGHDSKDVAPSVHVTLEETLKYWVEIQSLRTRMFIIARAMIKYGDVFYRKKDDLQRWTFIHPSRVIAAMTDEDDESKVLALQIRKDPNQMNKKNVSGQDDIEMEQVDIGQIIRFSLIDEMADTVPFGKSVLQSIFRAQKQKELLEDAIIIYRIQRAPERRVFYIDVGKMPPQLTKKYLENIKNELKQRRVPSMNGGTENIDSTYNPQSMSEDIFLAQRADGKGSRVETLPGGQGLGELADLEYFENNVLMGLRIPINWMRQAADGGAHYNDGQVGQAYIQELRFCKFIERIQQPIEAELDIEFKRFVRANDINVDESLYRIALPEPMNFGKYRQQELNAALLTTASTADGMTILAKRTVLTKYMQMEQDEILENEKNLRLEKNLPDDCSIAELYGTIAAAESDMVPGIGGGGSGMGGPMDFTDGATGNEGTPGADSTEGQVGLDTLNSPVGSDKSTNVTTGNDDNNEKATK